ncbi:hypothetical protein CIL05_02440 [Virgibacillus profundi]|uniref:Aminoglycoside phosphotransferase domain-containing protein n=1 Tax=Virgibacillus profundi TaxID=2024555 RepID=A0A2A2IJP2_9BACI|nr:phosphotransferase [Virgibacillus profundi]PAV31536.1 hypothetical protein CIL05_02440 [Virgibacillus profundi]PXY55722.1 hypothetical protein CIT14_02450 [Virgibacillus profundi]
MRGLKRLFQIILEEGFYGVYFKLIGKVKSRILSKLMKEGKWEKAIRTGETLLSIFPDNMYYPLKVAECYQNINKDGQAYKIIQNYFDLNFNLNDVFEISEKQFSDQNLIKSKYLYLGGSNNEGLIEHRLINNKYLTKITQSEHKEVEKLFYSKIYKLYPEIKKVTPKFMGITQIKEHNLSLITMQKVEGMGLKLNDKVIHEVGKISKIISSITYGEIYKWFPSNIVKSGSEIHKLLWSFDSIHREHKNKELFMTLYNKMEQLNYLSESILLIERVETIIMEKKMYEKLQPMKHYSVQHGDFFYKNLLSEDNKIYVVDWGCMKIGPSWCDMAGFLGEIRQPFNKIHSNFLLNEKVTGHFEPIEKLFFIYTLITVWISEFSKKEFNNSLELYLRPAVELIEEIAKEIEIDKHKSNVKRQLNTM